MRTLTGITLLCLLSGCARTESKAVIDFVQYLLSQDTWLRWIACLLLVYLLLQTFRIVQLALRFFWQFLKKSYRFIFIWGKRNLILITVLGTALWLLSNPLIDLMQEVEQRFFSPVFVNEFSSFTDEHLTAIFEAELARHVDPYQKEIVMRRTRETAAKIQSTPAAIYQAAYLECGLKPFEVRSDKVAAGWIQFTRAGLGSLIYKGRPVTFDEVLAACQSKDIEFMMDLTELYFLHKYQQCGQKPLNHPIDLYLALFAPVHIGAPKEQVVYEGLDNPSYFKNNGLDGWYVAATPEGQQQIFHKRSARDGKITIYEIYLALEAKKNLLLLRYLGE